MRNRIGMVAAEDRDAAVAELEEQVALLKKALADSNSRNQRLVAAINKQYGVAPSSSSSSRDLFSGTDSGSVVDLEDGTVGSGPGGSSSTLAADASFLAAVWDRGSWLATLLLFQSFSSFILAHHEALLKEHPTIIFYLTALVGAGGNAGNQAAVRIIRSLALGLVTDKTRNVFLQRELCMAFALSFILGFVLILRTHLSSSVTYMETRVVLLSMFCIVFISCNLGALLPLVLQRLGIDPAHAGTTIQGGSSIALSLFLVIIILLSLTH